MTIHLKRGFILIGCVLLAGLLWAQTKSPANLAKDFIKLSPGMTRTEAEKEIARVRNVKTTYDLWAMDTSALAAYKLDSQTILLVKYKPGTPAAHVSAPGNGHPPVDGTLIEYSVLPLH